MLTLIVKQGFIANHVSPFLVFDTFKSSVYLLKQLDSGCFFSISIENNVFICYNSKNQ